MKTTGSESNCKIESENNCMIGSENYCTIGSENYCTIGSEKDWECKRLGGQSIGTIVLIGYRSLLPGENTINPLLLMMHVFSISKGQWIASVARTM